MRVLREAPAPSDEQANQAGAFGGQLAALQRAFEDYKESAFSVDEDSGRSKTKKKKKKKTDDDSYRGRSKTTKDRKVKKQMQTLQGGTPIRGET